VRAGSFNPVNPGSSGLARISHTILARLINVGRFSYFFERSRYAVAPGDAIRAGAFCKSERDSGGLLDDTAEGTRCGGTCQAGEPRALAAALRRRAAQPQIWAAGQLDAIAILMRRTLTRTNAPILSSLRRMVPQLALANGV
jgi:hypothetical protein